MAGGFVPTEAGKGYEGRVTVFVLMTCLVAATGGLLFGYDIGISGGVTSMQHFLKKFFPMVYRRVNDPHFHEGQYCKYDNHLLTLFTSSLYLAALVACIFASTVMKLFGRKVCMFIGGLAFLAGATLNGTATNLAMLIAGRMLLGVGVGFSNQSVPVYLSEMAPPKLRGALNNGFQQAVNIGILSAGLINYGTAKITGGWGWRISLALAAVPAIIMTIGTSFLPDTPNSIIARGHPEKAKALLCKVRGTSNVDVEFQDLVLASQTVEEVKHPWKNILERKYRPQLVACVLVPFFQQVTGINVIMFYAPVLFKTLGFGDNASLMSAVISGAMLVIGTGVSIYAVDRFGRRVLFISGGYIMIISQIMVGVMVGWKFGVNGSGHLSKTDANLILFFICVYVVSFAWSWGPLGWLVPAEICPLEIRFAGQAVTVAVNMFFTFAIAQVFLSMLCHFKFGLFFFFAAWVGVMTAYVHFLLPETKNVPIEEINRLWLEHPFWRKYVADDDGVGVQAPAEGQLKNV